MWIRSVSRKILVTAMLVTSLAVLRNGPSAAQQGPACIDADCEYAGWYACEHYPWETCGGSQACVYVFSCYCADIFPESCTCDFECS
jgi:hypothetical protein